MIDPLRVVAIGDSITQAANGRNSYRKELWEKLIQGGYNVDFVGSQNQPQGGNTFPDSSFDPDHEGHWGWRIDEIINGKGDDGKLSDWLQEYTPDIALIHLGSNDAFWENPSNPTRSINELQQVIRILRQDNPNIVIFVAQLIPTQNRDRDQKIDQLNALIPGLVTDENTPTSPVFLVDQNSGFDPNSDTYDGIHPDDSGEAKMAQRWFDAIKNYLDDHQSTTECFLAGTHILTDRGEVLVENLAIGHWVQTAEGKLQPIKWIGQQTVNHRWVRNSLRSHPIRVKAGGLGDNLPLRDLYVSPDHALLVDDLLINAGALVNGSSILKTKPAAPFTYYHVELATHSLLVAEGIYAESYLPQLDDRKIYDNGDQFEALYPHQDRMVLWPLSYPRVSSAIKVPRCVRKRLQGVANDLLVPKPSDDEALQPSY